MKNKILLIGAGGHCRSIIDSINKELYADIGILVSTNEQRIQQDSVLGISIIGTDADAQRLFMEGYSNAVIALGSIGNPADRIELYTKYKAIGFNFPTIIDSTAIVSKNSFIGDGVFIAKGSVLNTGVCVGECVIINTGAIIDHDCNIGDFVHIGPNASLSGEVIVGRCAHIGVGSSIIQCICIGENTVVGAGSVVTRDIPPNCTAVGVPAIPIKSRNVKLDG